MDLLRLGLVIAGYIFADVYMQVNIVKRWCILGQLELYTENWDAVSLDNETALATFSD